MDKLKLDLDGDGDISLDEFMHVLMKGTADACTHHPPTRIKGTSSYSW
jgi:hypothetical protein